MDQIDDAYGTCNTATWEAFLAFDKQHRCGVPDLSDDGDRMEWKAFEAGASFGAQKTRKVLEDGPTMAMPDFLEWIAARLVNVYGESENVDFVISLRERAAACRTVLA